MAGEIIRRRTLQGRLPSHLPLHQLHPNVRHRKPLPSPSGPIVQAHRRADHPPTGRPLPIRADHARRRHPPIPDPQSIFLARRRMAHSPVFPGPVLDNSTVIQRIAPPLTPVIPPIKKRHTPRQRPATLDHPHSRRTPISLATVPAVPQLGRRKTVHRGAQLPPAAHLDHSKRRRLPGSGLSATSFVVSRNRLHLRHSAPAAMTDAHPRRKKSLIRVDATAIVLRRRGSHLLASHRPEDLRGHPRRRRPFLSAGLAPVLRHRSRKLHPRPPARVRTAHALPLGIGQTAAPIVLRHRSMRARHGANPAQLRTKARTRRGVSAMLGGMVVIGPFFAIAQQVVAAGAIQGDVREMYRA